MAPTSSDVARPRVRAALRALRRALRPAARAAAARAVTRELAALRWLRPGMRVALYSPIDGELDTRRLIDLARARGCRVYLPRITSFRQRRLCFAPLAARRSTNRYGIPEPTGTVGIAAQHLDLVLAPLVAFDDRGTRLGMGAGFYDRALAFRRRRGAWRRPRIVGVAFSLQEVPRIAPAAHDVPLDAVITEGGTRFFGSPLA